MANDSYVQGSVSVGTTATLVCTVPAAINDVLVYCSVATVFGGPSVGIANANDVQTVTVNGTPTGGSYTLTFNGQTTVAIAYNAAAATIQTALINLSNIGPSDVAVTGSGPYTVTFQSTLGNAPQSVMTHTDSLTGGTTPNVSIAHTTTGAAGGVTVPATTLTQIPATGSTPHDLYAIVSTGTSTVAYMFPE
jgi:hypothetical protein